MRRYLKSKKVRKRKNQIRHIKSWQLLAKSPRKKKIKNKIGFGKNYSFFHTKKTNLSTGKYFKSGKKCYKNKLKRILFEF